VFSMVAMGMLLAVSYGLHKVFFLLQLGPVATVVHYTFAVFPAAMFVATMLSNPGIYDAD
jgi:hypothetical protein